MMGFAEVVLALLAFGVVLPLGTVWMLLRLWRRWQELSLRGRAAAATLGGSALVGAWCTTSGMLTMFGALGGESVDASQRAVVSAAHVPWMANHWLSLAVGLWLPSLIALAVLTRRRVSSRG